MNAESCCNNDVKCTQRNKLLIELIGVILVCSLQDILVIVGVVVLHLVVVVVVVVVVQFTSSLVPSGTW